MALRFALPLILLASCSALLALKAEQENKVPTAADLQAITSRGKMLAEYDVAAWHAMDVVQDMKPEKGSRRKEALAIPEYVGTRDKKIYVIQTDGTILLGK